MTREEAIKEIESWEFLEGKEIEAIETLIPELRENEDEKIRKWLIEMVEEIRKANPTNAEHNGNCSEAIAYLEKQKEQKPLFKQINDSVIWDSGLRTGIELGKQKEQKLDLTVKGNGVYKICPHCKSRMIRDESKVYTSIPPQYGYNCPKCGNVEFDTVMYDNPEMEEQNPTLNEDDEHYELEEFAKIVRGNLTGISRTVLELFENKYLQLTGNKMFGGYKD